MIFSSLFSHREKTTICALIDIQSGLVRGSIVAFSKSSLPRIIYTTLHIIPHKHEVSSEYVTKVTLKGVTDVVGVLSSEGFNRLKLAGFGEHIHLDSIHYVLSSPWVISQTKAVKIKFDKPTTITQTLVQGIIDEARKDLETGYVKKSREGQMLFDAAFIEQKVFEVKLNGYIVNEFAGKVSKELDISSAISVSSKKLLERISDAGRQQLHAKKSEFHSALLLEYVGIRNTLKDMNEYIVVHVHSELTDVIVVKNGMCRFVASFPVGVSSIIRKISKNLHETEALADSTLSLLGGKKLSSTEEVRIGRVVGDIGKGWLYEFMDTLTHAGEHSVIPKNIVLSTHSHYPFFDSLLKSAEGYTFATTPLEPEMVEGVVAYDKGQENSVRMGLYSLAISQLL